MEARPADDQVLDDVDQGGVSYRTLEDGPPTWRTVVLSGWFERQGFHPLMSAFLMFVVSFLLFQGLASVIAIVMIVAKQGVPDPTQVMAALESATGPLLVGNTIGQFVGMAIPVLLWTRLHTDEPGAFLRIGKPDWVLTGLSVVALLGLLPVIQWLGELNASLPIPDFLVELEEAQLELIARILEGDTGLGATIFALAITPAICEELLFRGYLQRQMERGLGVAAGIVATGILFGVYHFRLSQVLPLAVLGIFLCWLAWRTGSLWVPMLVHFLNNGVAIVAASVATSNPELGIDDLEHLAVPMPILIGGAVVLAGSVLLMNRRVLALGASQA